MIGIFQILSTVIGAVVLAVGVDPSRDFDAFLGRQRNLVMIGLKIIHQLAGMGAEAVRRKIVVVSRFGMVFADNRDHSSIHELFIRDAEEFGFLSRQIKISLVPAFIMTFDAVSIPDGLNIRGVIERSCPSGFPGLRSRDGRITSHGHGENRVGGGAQFHCAFVTSDTRPYFAGPIIDESSFTLNLHVVLVKCLEEYVLVGLDQKMGRTVLLDRHNAMLNFQPQM